MRKPGLYKAGNVLDSFPHLHNFKHSRCHYVQDMLVMLDAWTSSLIYIANPDAG